MTLSHSTSSSSSRTRTRWLHHVLVLIVVCFLALVPGSRANYVRNPNTGSTTRASTSSTSSTSSNTGSATRGQGFGSVSISLRQRIQGDNGGDDEDEKPVRTESTTTTSAATGTATFFVDKAQEQEPNDDDVVDNAFFQETEFPTGLLPTQSAMPTVSLYPTWAAPLASPTLATSRPATLAPGSTTPPVAVTTTTTTPPVAVVTSRTTTPPVATTTTTSTIPPTSRIPATLGPTTLPPTTTSATTTTYNMTTSQLDEVAAAGNTTTTQSPTLPPTSLPTASDTLVSNQTETDSPTTSTTTGFDDTANNVTNLLNGATDDLLELEEVNLLDNHSNPLYPGQLEWTTVTIFPTAAPSMGLTTATDVNPEFPVSGQLSLLLHGIVSPMSTNDKLIFLATADEYIASASAGQVEDIKVLFIYQNVVTHNNKKKKWRHLQQQETSEAATSDQAEGLLQVDLGVEGLAFDEMLSDRDWNMWIYNLFLEPGATDFVTMLQDLGEAEANAFFETITKIQALEPAVIPSETITANTSGVLPPPLVASSSNQETYNEADQDDNDGGTPMVAIIGAAVGGVVLLLVGALLVRYVVVMERKKYASSPGGINSRSSSSSADNFGGTSNNNNNNNKKNNAKNQKSITKQTASTSTNTAIQNKSSAGESIVSSSSYLTSSTNNFIASTALFGPSHSGPDVSSPPSESDNQSHMGGTTNGDMSVMDNMSYAYSLEPGIEPSVAGVPPSVIPSSAASAMSFSVYPGGSSVASMTSGTSSFAFMKPMNNRGGNGAGGSGGGIGGKPTKDVLAPPGKLGIVIDTTLDGPVVHKVNPGSALEGKLKSGDIIVAIDGVDTRAMTAASITALMVKTANQRRKLTIITP